jgi:hypothetical protein
VCVGSARTGTRVLLEVLGPAGAGKSTLIAAMEARDPRIRRAKLPSRGQMLRAYARLAVRFAAARRRAGGSPLTRAEARALSIAKAWSHRPPEGLVVFDHGPLFRLVQVRAFGPPLVKDGGFTGWWHELFERWAALLDAVVFLDATDDVLVRRIRTRPRHHAAKALDDASAAAFLAAYRDGFDRVRRALAERGTRVITIDSAATEPLAIADRILAAMEELHPAHHDRTHEARSAPPRRLCRTGRSRRRPP